MHDHVSIRIAAARLAGFDASAKPPPRLVGQILQIERIHRALKADMQLTDLALRQGHDLDAGKAKTLVDRCRVLLVAGKPVQRLLRG